ncbi:MAG: 4-hydroxy-3-methylbut-2-enyl diphosphate reductase [Verrucomicrobiae bacterium]|nr:4-hydroxy-3-methylbut-2-enyl diphosphate reductase [Verrucomicrobiae bacterium]
MKIKLAKAYGMCFGVKDAIQLAYQNAKSLTIWGELVHNPIVLEELQKRGAYINKTLENPETLENKRVMITAHGVSNHMRQSLASRAQHLFDGTCPLVKKAHHTLARLVEQGYHPVVIGQRHHVEVKGLTGDYPNAVVIEKEEDMVLLPAYPRLGVIAQTTFRVETVQAFLEILKRMRPYAEIKFCDTVCQPTKDRQNAVKELAKEVNLLIVIGGKNSNNSTQLVHLARELNCPVHKVERAEEICESWFDDSMTVGVTAGTSTPESTIQAVIKKLEAIQGRFNQEVA